MEKFSHRDYKIIAESYQTNKGKWVPRARIIPLGKSMNQEESAFDWPQEFETQLEADDFAIDGAEFYIDERF